MLARRGLGSVGLNNMRPVASSSVGASLMAIRLSSSVPSARLLSHRIIASAPSSNFVRLGVRSNYWHLVRVSGVVATHPQRRSYASAGETQSSATAATAEAAMQSGAAAQSGADAMAAYIATAEPAVSSTVPVTLTAIEQAPSLFPPVNWLVEAMTLTHYAVPLSWAATIVVFTAAFRTMILPAVAMTMQNSAKMRALTPELERIKAKYGPQMGKDVSVAMQYRTEVREAMSRSGVNMWKTLLPLFVQTPLFISFFFSTRKLAEVEPSLHDAGFWIFNDLAAADPYYVVPAITALSMLATIELGSDGVGGQTNPAIKNFLRFFSLLIIPATSSLPLITHIYWLTSNVFSLGQLALFKVPFVKKAFKIPDYEGVSPVAGGAAPKITKAEMAMSHKPKSPTDKPQ